MVLPSVNQSTGWPAWPAWATWAAIALISAPVDWAVNAGHRWPLEDELHNGPRIAIEREAVALTQETIAGKHMGAVEISRILNSAVKRLAMETDVAYARVTHPGEGML